MSWILIILTVLFALLYWKIELEPLKITDSDFLFQFIGILLGFALTIFPFIVSMVDRVIERKQIEYKDFPEKLKVFQTKTKNLFSEIKYNIIFIFYTLLIVSLVYFSNELINPLIRKSLFSAIFCLNLYAIYDLIIVSFRVSETTAISEN